MSENGLGRLYVDFVCLECDLLKQIRRVTFLLTNHHFYLNTLKLFIYSKELEKQELVDLNT